MASYPYSSPPPPPPPCSNTTSPILQPPPPPPPPACNHTPPPAHYSPSPPPCNCNKATPTLPPPHLPPPPPTSYYSPPSASLSPPPLPPPSPHRYSPPIHSPPPPSSQPSPVLPPPPSSQPSPVLPPPSPPSYFPPPSSDYSPPPPPPKPSPPTPWLQPTTPPPSPSPYYPQTPPHLPPSPAPSPCHCVCPSPWPIPPNSIPPNYYAPAPSPLSSDNHQRTVIVTAFVSLGGVFFLSFIVIGLLSVAMKKKMFRTPRLSGGPEADPLSNAERQLRQEHDVREFQSIPAGTEHVMHDPKVQAPPDKGVVEQREGVQHIPSETEKKSVNPNVDRDSFGDNQGKVDEKLGEPSSEQSGDKIEEDNQGKVDEKLGEPSSEQSGDKIEEGKSNEGNNKPLDDRTDASPDEESKSNTIPEESNEGASNESQKKPRVPKIKKAKGGKKGKGKHSGIQTHSLTDRVLNVARILDSDEVEQSETDDNDQEQVDEKLGEPSSEQSGDKIEEGKSNEGNTKPLDDRTDASPDEESKSNTIPEESNEGASNESQKKPRVPKIKNAKGGKKGKGKHSGIQTHSLTDQVLNVARILDSDEVEQSETDDNDQEQVDEKLGEPSSEQSGDKIEEEKSNEGNNKPLDDRTDASPDEESKSNTIPEESNEGASNESQKKPRVPKIKNAKGGKKGKGKHSGIQTHSLTDQVLNVACILDSDEVEQSETDDNDQEQVDEKLGEPSSEQSGDKIEEEKSNEGNNKPLDDRTDASPDEESKSNTIPEESNEGASNESQKKPRVPKIKNAKGGKKGTRKHSGIQTHSLTDQVLHVARIFDSDEVEQSETDDNDQEQVDEKLGEPSSEQSGDKIEEGKSNEGNNKPLDDRTDASPDEESKSNTIPEESNEGASNEFQKKPCVPKIKNAKGGKKGTGKHSGIQTHSLTDQVLNVARTLDPDEAEQSQTDDNDQEQVSGTEAQDDTNYEDEKVECPKEDEQEAEERDGKSLSDQTETNKTNSAQDVIEGSNNSKKKLRLSKKNNLASNSANKRKGNPSSSCGVTKGKEQLFGVSQVPNPANIFDLGGAGNFQDGDNDEAQDDEETYELEPEDDDKEMIAGGSNRADEIVKHANADEQELNEHHGEPLSHHQSERYTRDSAQHVEEESSTLEEKSKDSKKILPKKKKPSTSSGFKKGKEESSGIYEVLNAGTYFDQDDAPQVDNNDAGEVTQLEPLEDDENLNSGGSNDTSEEVVPPSNADADVPNECEQNSLENQSESDSRGATENAEQESTAIKEESNVCSSKPLSNQSYSNNADAIQDLEKPYATKEDSNYSKRKQALKKGRGSSSRSHPQGKIQYSNFGLLNEAGNVYSKAVQSQEDDNDGLQMEEFELQHDDEDLNSGGNDSRKAMVSFDDVEDKVKVSDLSASAHGSKQALSKVVVLDGGDYKDGKAKIHEMKSSSSKKDLQERQQRTHAKKNFNLGKIGTAASLRDQGTAMVSLDDEDDNVQESEPFASNLDSYFGQLQTSAEGIEQSPNFFRNFTTKSDIDPIEELKSLGEGSYKGKKAEVQKLSKDSRRIKGQIKGPGTKIEPPELNQIVTGRSDDDLGILGKGLECLGGNQEGGSDKDGSSKDVTGSGQTSRGRQQISNLFQSLATTDEGDPNPELEICVDDSELESHLSLQEHSVGEVEPSTEDQSVFVTAEDDQGDVYSEAVQSQEDENDGLQMEKSELQHNNEDLNSSGNDSSRAMVSLDDVEREVKVSDLSASAQGSKQALSKVVVLDGGDYKDGKAKVHEMKSSSSKKDLQERQHRTQAKKNFNLGKIGTAASLSDQGMAMVSLDDEDDNVQESEPFASNVDSYFGQLQTSAGGIEQSPNFFGNLTTKSDIDPVEELKSLGEGSYKGKKAEVHKLSKDSRRIKGQIKGPGTKIETSKLSQIVTGRIDDDLGVLGKGLQYLGGNQEGGSDKDGSGKEVTGSGRTSRGPQQIPNLVQSLASTDEGDPNPELEICEDDRELESGLSLQEPSAAEVEPSTEDQRVFVTAEDDSDVLQFLENEYDEEPAESNKDVPTKKPPSGPRSTNLRGKRRA